MSEEIKGYDVSPLPAAVAGARLSSDAPSPGLPGDEHAGRVAVFKCIGNVAELFKAYRAALASVSWPDSVRSAFADPYPAGFVAMTKEEYARLRAKVPYDETETQPRSVVCPDPSWIGRNGFVQDAYLHLVAHPVVVTAKSVFEDIALIQTGHSDCVASLRDAIAGIGKSMRDLVETLTGSGHVFVWRYIPYDVHVSVQGYSVQFDVSTIVLPFPAVEVKS